MDLLISKREKMGKCANRRIRREGGIPAVVYSKGEAGDNVTVNRGSYEAALRQIKPGHLPTTIFNLKEEGGKDRKVLVKDVHYHATTYDVEHLDLEELHEDVEVNAKVPIVCTGQGRCEGIKEGGVLRQVIRHTRVRCLPKHLPSEFQLDISSLKMKESKRLSDLSFADELRPLDNLQEVAAAIVKR